MNLQEPLKELYGRSRLLILDFSQIPAGTPADESMEHYFVACADKGINPRLPENRQAFNDHVLAKTGTRYLISRYGEDRRAMLIGSSIAAEGRTLHLGVDIFSKELETVYAPCDGVIVRTGQEPEDHSFGHYLIFKPDDLGDIYLFFGHLSSQLPPEGTAFLAGQPITTIGDFVSGENGGWSRHLHLQILTTLPAPGEVPIGYSTQKDFPTNSQLYPNPHTYFPSL